MRPRLFRIPGLGGLFNVIFSALVSAIVANIVSIFFHRMAEQQAAAESTVTDATTAEDPTAD